LHVWAPLHILPASAQSAQDTPLAPHAVSMFPGKHVVPLRHPGQTHLFMEQVSPFAVHATHMLPPLPHASFAFPGLHVVPVQQPPPQDIESQTHVPLLHACPVPQGWEVAFCH
jgi:hypothetical protein